MRRITKEVRAEYRLILLRVWKRWKATEVEGSPFTDLSDSPLDDEGGFNYDVGWIHGMSDATGWPTDCPMEDGDEA